MKRFYCTVCKKMKRVRNTPRIIENMESINPDARVGECNYHRFGRVRVMRPRVVSAPKPVAVNKPSRKAMRKANAN